KEANVGAVATGRGNFHLWRVFRKADNGASTRLAGGERHGLRMIARRNRNHAAPSFVFGERKNLVGSAAGFERACALQVFAFEKDFTTGDFIEGTGSD